MFFRKRKWNSLMVRALAVLHNVCLDAKDMPSKRDIQAAVQKHCRLAAKEKKLYAAMLRAGTQPQTAFKDSLAAGVVRRHAIALKVGARVAF